MTAPNEGGISAGEAGGALPPGEQAAQAIQQLRDKQAVTDRRNARWGKLAGGALAIVALVRIGVALLPPIAKTCDDADVRSTVLDIFNKQYKATGAAIQIRDLTGVSKVSSSDQLNRCSATAQFSDGRASTVSYEVTPKRVEARLSAIR